jgi:hypothetical protein
MLALSTVVGDQCRQWLPITPSSQLSSRAQQNLHGLIAMAQGCFIKHTNIFLGRKEEEIVLKDKFIITS